MWLLNLDIICFSSVDMSWWRNELIKRQNLEEVLFSCVTEHVLIDILFPNSFDRCSYIGQKVYQEFWYRSSENYFTWVSMILPLFTSAIVFSPIRACSLKNASFWRFYDFLLMCVLQYYPKFNNGHHTKPSNLYVC